MKEIIRTEKLTKKFDQEIAVNSVDLIIAQ